MLFKINSEGFYRLKGNIRAYIRKGADTIDTATKDLQRQFNDMKETNQRHQPATQIQLTTITSSLNNITKSMSYLEHRIVSTQRALLAQSQEVGFINQKLLLRVPLNRLRSNWPTPNATAYYNVY
jgi:hypothetical protein